MAMTIVGYCCDDDNADHGGDEEDEHGDGEDEYGDADDDYFF